MFQNSFFFQFNDDLNGHSQGHDPRSLANQMHGGRRTFNIFDQWRTLLGQISNQFQIRTSSSSWNASKVFLSRSFGTRSWFQVWCHWPQSEDEFDGQEAGVSIVARFDTKFRRSLQGLRA